MKHLIVSATALTLLAGSAFAQEATPTPPPSVPAQTVPTQTQTPPPAELTPGNGAATQNDDQDLESYGAAEDQMDDMGSDQRERADAREARRGHGHHWDRDRPRGHHWRGADRGSRHGRDNEGAHFRLTTKEDGEVELDVRCAANEPMQACAEIVNGLLDRLNNNNDTTSEERDDL